MNLTKLLCQSIFVVLIVALELSLNFSAQAQTTGNRPVKQEKLFDLQNGTKVNENVAPGGQNQSGVPKTASAASSVSAKKAGNIRIGIVGAGGEAAADAFTLTATVKFLESLDGKDFAPFDTVALQATTQTFLSAEASSKQCDYILYVEDVTKQIHKDGGWGLGKVIKKIKSAIPFVPNIVPGKDYWEAYRSGQKVMNAGELLSAVAGEIKAKDEISVTYRLFNVGKQSDVAPKKTETRVAQKDGENVLGSLVVKISEEVLTKAVKH